MTVVSYKNNRILDKIQTLVAELEQAGFSRDDIIDTIKTEREGIPISIFRNDSLSPLETITKYLKENQGLKYGQIAKILRRNPIPIGITYRHASSKMKSKVDDSSADKIPFSIFEDDRLSVLENIVYFLKSRNLKYCEIARITNRDDRTIWTVYHRALAKKGGKK